ncbi:MAG TPA: YcxB family protein [Candidatus Angelobacter sp.]|nr:YcxB family protein [Candidatus Angelobacter sp.]
MLIEYEISEQDFVNAQRLAFRNLPTRVSSFLFRLVPFWGLLMLVFVTLSATQPRFHLHSTMIVPVLFGLLFLFSPWLFTWAQRMLFRRTQTLHGRRTLTVDEAGLTFTSSASSSQLEWGSFQKFVEDDTVFDLYLSSSVFHIVPKRELSPEQITELREAFTRNIVRKR